MMILDVIVEDKKKRLKEHKARISEEKMKELALASERKSISFYEALAKPGLSIIGEFKKASPSMGQIKMTMELTDRIDDYNASVDAISCLTEEDHFLGNTDYFKKIQPKIIGVNNRNLKDFTISLENTKRLRPMVPEGAIFVSESGVTENEHITFLKECKVDALLIGGAFMLSEHPRELATEWKNLYNEK